MSDELRERFQEHTPADETDGSDGSSTAHNTDGADSSGDSPVAPSSSESDGTNGASGSDESPNVRDRPQMSMYLPPEVKSRVEDDYEKLDAKSKLADQGGLRKNDDFFVGMIEFALGECREEFEEFLGIEE